MEKYKFRGKSLNTGEWIYGSLLQINDDAYIYPYKTGDLDDIDFGCGFIKVSKESVGQFIGLKDKNGVKIFRDDLTKINGAIYQVVYLNGAYRFVDVKSGDFWQYARNLAISSFGEVIGNIHEHSHLLDNN